MQVKPEEMIDAYNHWAEYWMPRSTFNAHEHLMVFMKLLDPCNTPGLFTFTVDKPYEIVQLRLHLNDINDVPDTVANTIYMLAGPHHKAILTANHDKVADLFREVIYP